MQVTTDTYDAAIFGDSREIKPFAVISVIDPDIVYDPPTGSAHALHSDALQIYDGDLVQVKFATLEKDRWKLDGSWDIYPTVQAPLGTGWVSDEISGDDGTFSNSVYLEYGFENVEILQVATVCFPGGDDGVAEDFVITIYQDSTILYQITYAGNTKSNVIAEEFTVNNPNRIRIDVSKWSLPHRKCRILEMVPGLQQLQDADDIFSIDIIQQADFSGLTCPYGSCDLEVSNETKRYNPFAKNSIFKSIEERQPVKTWMQIRTDAGWETIPSGVYYQKSGGWDMNSYSLTATFKLVDIIGLLQTRTYTPPSPKPTTVRGWVESVVAVLGDKFTCEVSADIAEDPLTTNDDTSAFDCGSMLRYICMATQSFMRTNPETGALVIDTLPAEETGDLTFDNMIAYPSLSASGDCVSISFVLADGASTKYDVAGNNISGDTLSLYNPFISTEADADAAAAFVLLNYGKTKIITTDRGNPAFEIGDINAVSVWTNTARNCRRKLQELRFDNGILTNCRSEFLEVVTD